MNQGVQCVRLQGSEGVQFLRVKYGRERFRLWSDWDGVNRASAEAVRLM